MFKHGGYPIRSVDVPYKYGVILFEFLRLRDRLLLDYLLLYVREDEAVALIEKLFAGVRARSSKISAVSDSVFVKNNFPASEDYGIYTIMTFFGEFISHLPVLVGLRVTWNYLEVAEFEREEDFELFSSGVLDASMTVAGGE